MNFSDIIGYIISILVLFYFMRGSSKRTEAEPEKNPDEQAQKLKDFLRSLEVDMQDQDQFKPLPKPKKPVPPQAHKKKEPPPAPKPISRLEDREFKSAIEDSHLQTAVYKDYEDPYKHYVDPYQQYKDTYKVKKVSAGIGNAPSYEVSGKEGISRADRLLSQLKSRKEMVLMHEIFGRPKGELWRGPNGSF